MSSTAVDAATIARAALRHNAMPGVTVALIVLADGRVIPRSAAACAPAVLWARVVAQASGESGSAPVCAYVSHGHVDVYRGDPATADPTRVGRGAVGA
jgi:hypothetical protein